MLLLLFKIQDENYAIDATRVVEVVPYLTPKRMQRTPDYILGLVNYRTKPIPVIELGVLLEDTPCCKLLSTRIIMINFPITPSKSKLLGLLAENVTETISSPADWLPPKLTDHSKRIHTIDSSFIDNETMIHWFAPEHILPHRDIKSIYRDLSDL